MVCTSQRSVRPVVLFAAICLCSQAWPATTVAEIIVDVAQACRIRKVETLAAPPVAPGVAQAFVFGAAETEFA